MKHIHSFKTLTIVIIKVIGCNIEKLHSPVILSTAGGWGRGGGGYLCKRGSEN